MKNREFLEPFTVKGKWWHILEDGRIQCDLCPRECRLREGQRGFCYIREAKNNGIVLTSYGKASGFCIDPIEKKPLNHFYPGTAVLSFGTAGCNLGCMFCQNWDISKSRTDDRLTSEALPKNIASTAVKKECKSIAFTYNDPVIFAEYAIDTAISAHEYGLKTVAVTAGYISPGAREEFYEHIDAVNIDLKSFTQEFYGKVCLAKLQPVLDTLIWIKNKTNVWIEITTLLIPDHNDSDKELTELSKWILENLGPDVPLHFTAFHPDFKMMDVAPTQTQTLTRARNIAIDAGLNFVYTGNIDDIEGQSTYCPNCKELLIERNWYVLGKWNIDESGHCKYCKAKLPGHFESVPGDWGAKRVPVVITAE